MHITGPRSTYIVSNRLPITLVGAPEGPRVVGSPGGLVTALKSIHRADETRWVGSLGGLRVDQNIRAQLEELKLVNVPMPRMLYKRYYNGASNSGIWPLFHYFPVLSQFSASSWRAYERVNQLFAERILAQAKDGDVVWVHDYQLMLLPALLRKENPRLRIGYFHHIPFPASEVLRIHPERARILEGLLGADLVGFHTLEYARHFVSAVFRELGHESHGEEVFCQERIVRVGAFPLGVDVDELRSSLKDPAHADHFDELKASFEGKTLILGVDRLDYTKGIKERLLGFRRFLKRNPDLRERSVFLQVCVPSRGEIPQYGNLRKKVERLVGRINGEFGTAHHAPVRYLYTSFGAPQLTALYRRADVCLVSPLRDGLNLVCKEYVACHPEHDGALVLSEFAGAAEEMGEAIKVNPYDVRGIAMGLETAVRMPHDERTRRMRSLHARVTNFDNTTWAKSFLEALDDCVNRNRALASKDIDVAAAQNIVRSFAKARRRILCFDVDALLRTSNRYLGRDRLDAGFKAQAHALSRLPDTEVLLLTGASVEEVASAQWPDGCTIVCEYGGRLSAPVDAPGQERSWREWLRSEPLGAARADVEAILERCAQRVPGSRVEIHECSLLWAYGHTRSSFAQSLARETSHALDTMLARNSWHCQHTRAGLEVRTSLVTYGTAVQSILDARGHGPRDFFLTCGDNTTDDTLYRVADGRSTSINIGPYSVFSRWNILDLHELAQLLASFKHEAAERNSSQDARFNAAT